MDSTKRSEKEDFWRLIISEQQASGVSARAFCGQEGISESQFYSWRSKIATRDSRPIEVDITPQLIPVSLAGSVPTSGLSDNIEGEGSSHEVEIQTPGGFTLRVSDGIASNRLGRLLSVLAHVDRDQQLELGANRC